MKLSPSLLLLVCLWTQLTASRGANYSEAVLAAGPVAYWRFEAINDASLTNSFTNAFQGTAAVTPAGEGVPLNGLPGNRALLLGQDGDYVRTGLDQEHTFTNGATFMLWMKLHRLPSSAGRSFALMTKSSPNNDLDLQLESNNQLMGYAGQWPNVFYDFNPALATGVWYHVAFSFSPSSGRERLYLNGVKVGDLAIPTSRTEDTNELILGSSAVWGGRYFNGLLDEAAVFDRALDDTEIQSVFASAGTTTPPPEPAVRVSMEIVHQRQPLRDGGGAYYGLNLNLRITPTPFNTTNMLSTPRTNHHVEVGGTSGFLGGGGYVYLTLGEVLNEMTNGLWKLVLNQGSPSEIIYEFPVSVTGLSESDLATATILSPLDGSQGNTASPAFTWTTSLPWRSNRVELGQTLYASEILPEASSSWGNAPFLPDGPYDFTLQISTNASPWVSVGLPQSGGSQSPTNWLAEPHLTHRTTINFRVGDFTPPAPGLQAHLRFDDQGFLGYDSSGQNHHAGDIWFTAPASFEPSGLLDGAADFTGSGWLIFPPSFTESLGGDFTVAVWINTTQSLGNPTDEAYWGAAVVGGDVGGQANDTIPIAINEAKAGFMTGNPDQTLHSFADVNRGNWTHVAVTRSLGTGEKKIYVNGVLDASGFGNSGLLDGMNQIHVGNGGGNLFVGLMDELQIYSAVLSASDIEFLYQNPGQVVTTFTETIAQAVDAPQLIWSTDPIAPWFSQAVTTHDGQDAAQSATIGDDQSTWTEVSLQGPGTLRFWWRVSSEDGFDYLTLSLDGGSLNELTGDSGWLEEIVNIPPGLHTVRWTYAKDSCCTDFDDAAWLDQVSYENSNSLGQAVDASYLSWTTGGNTPWFFQTEESNDGTDAAQSGVIQQGEESWIQTTVNGPGTLSFYYQVNDPNFESYLEFTRNGSYEGDFYGFGGWNFSSYVIPPGSQTLRWTFRSPGIIIGALNGPQPLATNAAWLDEVNFVNEVDPQIEIEPVGGVFLAGASTTLQVTAYAAPTPDYHWFKDGQPLPGISGPQLALPNLRPEDSGTYQVIVSNRLGYVQSNPTLLTVFEHTDLQPLSLQLPGSSGSQLIVPIVWSGTNTGPGSVSNWFDALYFSTNAPNASLSFVTSFRPLPFNVPLGPGQAYVASNQVRLPAIPAGQYLLSLRLDNANNRPEDNETNNSISVPITITNPDLQPEDISVAADAVGGRVLSVAWTVRNNGPSLLENMAWSDRLYLSTNQTYEFEDVTFGALNRSLRLASGESVRVTNSFTLPVTPSGPYFVLLRSDAFTQVLEADENNNEVFAPVNVTTPDLTPTHLAAPDIAGARQTIPVEFVVLNQGDATAFEATGSTFLPEWVDRLYLSTNATFEPTDRYLGAYHPSVPDFYSGQDFSWNTPLPPGETMTNRVTVQIPNVPEGDYFLLIVNDYFNYVRELVETNNALARPLTVAAPDLVPLSLSGPAEAEAYATVQLVSTVTNLGSATAFPVWSDRIYFSTNATLDAGDSLLGTFAQNAPLAGGQSYTRTNSVNLPGLTGSYFLLYYTDGLNNLFERDDSNNWAAVAITINSPDLAVHSAITPTNVASQQPVGYTFIITNRGLTLAQPGWGDRLHLSADEFLDTNDLVIGRYDFLGQYRLDYFWPEAVPPGGSYTQEVFFAIPGVAAGNYHLILKTDGNNFFQEANEVNNLFVSPLRIENPDLTPTNLIAPATIVVTQFNQRADIGWHVLNRGQGAAFAGWSDYLYLSPTNVLDTNAVLIGSDSTPPVLGPGASRQSFALASIPNHVQGNFYLLLRADATGQVFEDTETNNLLIQPIQIVIPPVPDLVVTNVTAPIEVFSGQEVEITWTIRNQGLAPVSGDFNDAVYLAETAAGDAPQHYGTFTFSGVILPGQSVTRRQRVTIPLHLSGPRWPLVVTDVHGHIFESIHEDNNFALSTSPLLIRLTPTPNLAIHAVLAPTNVFSSQSTYLQWVVTNLGTGPTRSPYWYDDVYLSPDTNFGGGDIYLGRVANPSYLSPGESYLNGLTVEIPRGLSGNWYFLLRTDSSGHVFENLDENDNRAVSDEVIVQLTPPPDLRVTQVLAPLSAFSGQSVAVNWLVTNAGLGGTLELNWNDRIYLSADTNLDGSDYEVGLSLHSGYLQVGESYVGSNRFVNLPIGVSGQFYFLVLADTFGQVYEQVFEANNLGVTAVPTTINLTPPPDLETLIVSAPTNALASHALTVSYLVENNGATVTPNNHWRDRLYLSLDAQLDPGADLLLADITHYGVLLPAGSPFGASSYQGLITGTLPDELQGTYWIFVVSDAGNAVFEVDNTNNVAMASQPVVINSRPADLVANSLIAPPTGNAFSAIQVSWTVSNQGTGDSAVTRWADRLILSSDTILGDGDDINLLEVTHEGLLPAGASYTESNRVVALPPQLANGLYQIYLVTDRGNQVYEATNENNNVFGPLPFTLARATADLLVTSVNHPASVTTEQPLTLQWVTANQGTSLPNHPYWYESAYLSADTFLSPDDLFLGYRQSRNQLAPGESYTNGLTARLPLDLSGDFHVLLIADASGLVIEDGAEHNNLFATTNTLHVSPAPVPDLEVTQVEAPITAFSGQPVEISWTVRNTGGAGASNSWYDAVFLSLDQFFDPNTDIYLGFAYRPRPLAPGGEYSRTNSFEIPPGLAGPFYVFVSSDLGQNVYERGLEQNNEAYDPLSMEIVLLPPVDLVAGPITVPVNGVPGRQATLSFTVFNQGSNTARGTWFDNLYLSTDTTWDVNDPFFASVRHAGDIAPNSNYTSVVTAELPGVLPGNYHLIVRSDIRNNILESDDTNNFGASLNSVAMDAMVLNLGVPDAGTVEQGQSVYYRFFASAGQTLRIRYTGSPDTGHELFVSQGRMPSRGQFDFAFNQPFVSSPDLLMAVRQTGWHYLLAYATQSPVPSSYSLLAEVLPFSVVSAVPGTVGNRGSSTLKVRGALFSTNTIFELIGLERTNLATDVYIEDTTTAYVTFSLLAQTNALYHLLARLPGTSPIQATLSNAVNVIAGVGPKVDAAIDAPMAVRVLFHYPFLLEYGNAGDSDALAPLLLVTGVASTPIGFASGNLQTGTLHVLGRSLTGPPHLLRPQDSYSLRMFFQAGSGVDARAVLATDAETITDQEWLGIEASVRPPSLTESQWLPLWANIRPRIGSTWGDYVRFLNRLAEAFPAEQRDVRAMLESIYSTNANFRAASFVSGRLLDSSNETARVGIEMVLYRPEGSNSFSAVSRSVTDDQGVFRFSTVPAGSYLVALAEGQFDLDRNGTGDVQPVTLHVAGDADLANLTFHTVPLVPRNFRTRDAHPVMTLDDAGTPHTIWLRNGELWHAWHDGANWVGAQAVARMPVDGAAFASAGNLLNGSAPGLIAAWVSGRDNASEIFYAVARPQPGGYEWSDPIRLTQDSVADSNPALLVTPAGRALVAYQKHNAAIQDDRDLYFSLVDVSSGQFLGSMVATSRGKLSPAKADPGSKITVAWNKEFGPWSALGGEFKAGITVGGEGAFSGCNLNITGSGELALTYDVPENYAVTGKGKLAFEAAFHANKRRCEYVYDGTTINAEAGMELDYHNGLLKVMSQMGPQGAAAAVAIRGTITGFELFTGLQVDNGIKVGGTFEWKNLQWNKEPPLLTNWRLPDKVSEFNLKVSLEPYAAVKMDDNNFFQLSGKAEAVFGILPSFAIKGVSGAIIFSGKDDGIPWASEYNLSQTFTIAGGPRPKSGSLPPGVRYGPYDPSLEVGTGAVYGTNAILANVASDVRKDGRPALARSQSGAMFAAWSHGGDPFVSLARTEIQVADFDGTNWSAPITLPGTLAKNQGVTPAFDRLGHRLVLWSMADSSALVTNATFAQVQAVKQSADLVYSVNTGSGWSAPSPVASTMGADRSLNLSPLANGDLLAIWTYRDASDVEHLISATWDGSVWTAPLSIASGTLGSCSLVAGTVPTVLWTADTDPSPEEDAASLFQSRFISGAWTAPALFEPALAAPAAPAVRSPKSVPTLSSAKGLNLLPPVPDECCTPCTEWTRRIRGSGNCVVERITNPDTCWEIIRYRPCHIASQDPNDITGPAGFGPENYVPASESLGYTIRFENDPVFATAPAQEVLITQVLDPDLDPRTFRLHNFGFGDIQVSVPDDSAFFYRRLDLTATHGYFVDVSAGVDVLTSEVFWRFTTIDPNTGFIPRDATIGFLAVNTNAPAGEGFVTYSVRPRESAGTGTRIDALATIIFDTEAPLDTPAIFHTLEAGVGQSAVQPLPTVSTPRFQVAWSGEDVPGGSGLKGYDVFVSVNGRPFTPWLVNTLLTEAPFEGRAGNQYAFYSVFADNAGNIEAVPPSPDAETLVPGENTAPAFGALSNLVAVELSPFAVAVPASDNDLPANLLTFELLSAPPGIQLDPTLGILTWVPTEAQGPSTNSITLRVLDDATPPLSATQTLSIVVLETNSPPTLAIVNAQEIDELRSLTLTLTATDLDEPANNLSFSLVNAAPAGLTLDSISGQLSWTPTEAQGPSTNNLSVRVTDNGVPGLSATQSFVIVVRETNSAPTLAAILDQNIPELVPFALALAGADVDLPPNLLSYDLLEGPAGLAVSSPAGILNWTPTEAQGGTTNQVRVRVRDDAIPSLSATQSFLIVVTEGNQAPMFVNLTNLVIGEGSPFNLQVEVADDRTPTNSLLVEMLDGPAGLAFDPTNRLLSWTPSEAQGPGTNRLTLRLMDDSLPPLSSTQSVEIVVLEVNVPPALDEVADLTIVELTPWTMVLMGTDADLPANSLSYELLEGPTGLSLDGPSGLLSWTPTEAQGPSTNLVSIRLADSGSPSLTVTQRFHVIVLESNQPPGLPAIGDQIAEEGSPFILPLVALDFDLPTNTLSFTLLGGAPAGLSLDASSGLLTWTPAETDGGTTHQIAVRVSDNGLPSLSATQSFTLAVSEINTPPSLAPIADARVRVARRLMMTNLASDLDFPSNRLVFSLAPGAPEAARIHPNTGVLTWTPEKHDGSSSNLITVVVTDDGVPPQSASQSFQVVVGHYAELSMGSTSLRAGETGRVAVTLLATAPVRNPDFTLTLPVAGLSNLTLTNLAAPLSSAILASNGSASFAILFTNSPGQFLQGTQQLAELVFTAERPESAFLPLVPAGFNISLADGSPVEDLGTTDGLVAMVAMQPLLRSDVSTNGVATLQLFGRTNQVYTIEYTTNALPSTNWQPAWQITLSNLFQTVELPRPTNQTIFYRARE